MVAPTTPAAQVQARRGSPYYPQGHGFMVAMRTQASQSTRGGTIRANSLTAGAGPITIC